MAMATVYAVNHYGRYCFLRLSPRAASTTVLENRVNVGSPATGRTHHRAAAAAGHGPGGRTSWRSRSARGVQAGPGAPRGWKPLGSGAGRGKGRGPGGEGLARSPARKAYAAMHKAPW